jgi:hypothetical protein
MTYVYTRESLASLFRAAADALQTPTSEPSVSSSALDYAESLEAYLSAHSHDLGNLTKWCRSKYAAEPSQAKAKSLLAYAQKEVARIKAQPVREPSF